MEKKSVEELEGARTEKIYSQAGQKIFPTQFGREDGKIVAICVKNDKWILRSICDPSWFWNKKINDWEIYHTAHYSADCSLTKDEALSLLPTLDPKDVK